jgi:light-regulated signal transduction histidine kinase (bacteriophytochrome)
MRAELGRWIGMLGLPFDPASHAWLLALRPEQVETVRWGGQPEKTLVVGPLGHRLTPRGSFDEWREVVRDSAEPWSSGELAIAQRLLGEMYRASSRRHAELDRLRSQLLAVLGHDLRDPLHAIKLAAQVMDRGVDPNPLGRRIQASSSRMQRLIGHVLDLSRLQGGIGMQLAPREVDVVPVLEELVGETRLSHPATIIRLDAPRALVATLDPDRFVQVAANLLSNARHHGSSAHPIDLWLDVRDGALHMEVSNGGSPLDEALVAELFRPFKRGKALAPGNQGGMGLGLYIAHQIVTAHGGALRYEYREPKVVFALQIPLAPPPAAEA